MPIEKVNRNEIKGDENQNNKFQRSNSGYHASTTIKCDNLPPLSFSIVLPVSYPSDTQPMFTLSCFWLNKEQLSQLCVKLDSIWKEYGGMAIVYTWVEWLQMNLIKYLEVIDEPDKLIVTPLGEYSNIDKNMILDDRAVTTFDDIEHCIYEFLRLVLN